MNTTLDSPNISDTPIDIFAIQNYLIKSILMTPNTDDTKKPVVTANTPVGNNDYATSPLLVPLLNQLPPITWFSSEEQPDGESFLHWLEQFESVAQLEGWSGHAKLVNLTTRLQFKFSPFRANCFMIGNRNLKKQWMNMCKGT